MKRNRRNFTEEEREILKANPYTYRVFENTIRFTLAFKEEFWSRYQSGTAPLKIVQELGYDCFLLGTLKIQGFSEPAIRRKQNMSYHITQNAAQEETLGGVFAWMAGEVKNLVENSGQFLCK